MRADCSTALLDRWIFVMVRRGDHFVAPYTADRWQAVTGEAAGYGPAFADFLARFCTRLTEAGWAPGSYYPGGLYRALAAQNANAATTPLTSATVAPYFLEELRVDGRGQWWVGRKHITGRVLQHFLRHLEYDAELARYRVHYRMETAYETRYLHHESPPIRVHRLLKEGAELILLLNTGAREPLRPSTLRLDADEQLYCAVGPAGVAACFDDPPRWELLKDAEPQAGDWLLQVDGRQLIAPLEAPWPFADAARPTP